jgi:hypothetical protein
VLVQRVRQPDGAVLINLFNTGDYETDRLVEWRWAGLTGALDVKVLDAGGRCEQTGSGVHVVLRPHASCRLRFASKNDSR